MDEGIEEGELPDTDEDEGPRPRGAAAPDPVDPDPHSSFYKIPWPPGKWRLGKTVPGNNNYMFLRYATKGNTYG